MPPAKTIPLIKASPKIPVPPVTIITLSFNEKLSISKIIKFNNNRPGNHSSTIKLTLKFSKIYIFCIEIAERLFLSVHTIKTHRKNIIKKLGFSFKDTTEVAQPLNT
ncbi:MAG: hypothetical protein H7289_12035 [Mucilaginibacter sp.]|nr:hypothetical protein [Mucilaginibacter sp.]